MTNFVTAGTKPALQLILRDEVRLLQEFENLMVEVW
jgi:hypothetical protein